MLCLNRPAVCTHLKTTHSVDHPTRSRQRWPKVSSQSGWWKNGNWMRKNADTPTSGHCIPTLLYMYVPIRFGIVHLSSVRTADWPEMAPKSPSWYSAPWRRVLDSWSRETTEHRDARRMPAAFDARYYQQVFWWRYSNALSAVLCCALSRVSLLNLVEFWRSCDGNNCLFCIAVLEQNCTLDSLTPFLFDQMLQRSARLE